MTAIVGLCVNVPVQEQDYLEECPCLL